MDRGPIDLRIARTDAGLVAERDGVWRALPAGATIRDLLAGDDAHATAAAWWEAATPLAGAPTALRAPLDVQEVWAAGVTYLRSRDARMAESERSGADEFYDRVYEAQRPELFVKATPRRVAGPGEPVRIRVDSEWDVPEPELVLVLDRHGRIVGHTAGNDMSSRSIEGANPLYLPQAKVYAACAALGPVLVLGDAPPPTTSIALTIEREGRPVFAGQTSLDRMRRSFAELVEHLFRDDEFPEGVFLMTGTGIVPPDGFTLAPGDVVTVTIDGVGSLTNPVVRGR